MSIPVSSSGQLLGDPVSGLGSEKTQDVLNRYKLPTITICGGILAAIFIFSIMLGLSMKQLERDFVGDARLRVTLLENWLSLNTNEVERLSHFLALSNVPTQEIFHTGAEPIIKGNAFEGIYLVALDSGKQGPLTVYDSVSREEMGLPITQAEFNAEIARALETRQALATKALAFPSDDNKIRMLIGLVFPIQDEGKLTKAIVALLDPKTLFEKIFPGMAAANVANGYLFTGDKVEQETMLYGETEALSPVFLAGRQINSALIEKSMAFSYERMIPLLSSQWKVVFVPTNRYMAEANMWMPWIMMIACLTLTGIAGIFLFHLIGRNARIEQLVRERTAELIHTSGELKVRSIDLERAKEIAEAANGAKGDFLANVSHEIRTPLNSMTGMAELLLETELTSQQENYIHTVINSAETLLEIINDILEFSKIESGKLELAPIAFDLREAIDDTVELFAPKAREKDQQLELLVDFVPGTPRHVIGDPVRIRQILSNLLSNAVKFTQAGYILVTIKEIHEALPDDKVKLRISVQDTGIGIPTDKLQIIFDKFSQADVSTTRKFGGTGLGLAICRQLSAMMQGEVSAQSVAGQGATFSAAMVLERDPAMHKETAIADRSVLKKKRVLIVDELEPSRTILIGQLSSVGMISEIAQDANAALKMLAVANQQRTPFDLLITDYILPEMISEVFTKQAKALCPNMAVVMVTALAEKGYAQIFASAGCDAYLTKPLRTEQLLDLLAMIFEAKRTGKHLSMLTPLNIFRKGKADRVIDDTGFLEGAEILLVEDNRANRELVVRLLENFRCRATAVRNGEEAVEIVKKQAFDLILMDCQMPEMDGFEASTIIDGMKKRGDIGDMPIIALTANAMRGDRERCLESGMNDYITKPLRKTKLRDALMQWLPPRGKRVMDKIHPAAA